MKHAMMKRLWTALLLLALASSVGARPNAPTILRRADLVRNPYLGTAVDVEMTVFSRATGRELRHSRHVMLTHRNGRTLVLMPQDDGPPGALLVADDVYHLLLPRAAKPVELALRHVAAGDLSHAGFLRVPLRVRYEPRDEEEAVLDGVPCWRLELAPKEESALFGQVRYWIAEDGFLPLRLEFDSPAGELLKTVRFTAYQETGTGPRPARIEIEDARRPDERTILQLGPPRGARTLALDFDLEDLTALRALASEPGAPEGGKELVDALVAQAR